MLTRRLTPRSTITATEACEKSRPWSPIPAMSRSRASVPYIRLALWGPRVGCRALEACGGNPSVHPAGMYSGSPWAARVRPTVITAHSAGALQGPHDRRAGQRRRAAQAIAQVRPIGKLEDQIRAGFDLDRANRLQVNRVGPSLRQGLLRHGKLAGEDTYLNAVSTVDEAGSFRLRHTRLPHNR